jgi:MFS superfamily sulfate permease-like transporter
MSAKLINKTSGKSDKNVVYRIEKDFSLNNIELVKSELESIAAKQENFRLEIKNMDSFDLSSIQLLHALKVKLGDKFTYSLEVKDEIKTIIKHSGFDYLLNM